MGQGGAQENDDITLRVYKDVHNPKGVQGERCQNVRKNVCTNVRTKVRTNVRTN